MIRAFQGLTTGAHTGNVPNKRQTSLFFLLLVIINQARWISVRQTVLWLSRMYVFTAMTVWPNWLSMDVVYNLFFSGFSFLIFKMEDFRMASGFKLCASSDWLVMSPMYHVRWEDGVYLPTSTGGLLGSLGGTKIQSVCEFLTWHIYESAFVLWVLQSGVQGEEWILLIFIFSGPSEEEGPEGSEGKTIDSVARETWSPIPELLFPSRVSVQR